MEVTAKELKNRLGKYLAAAEAGETIVVTSHGKPVAEICPVKHEETEDEFFDRLAAEGKIRRGKGGPLPDIEPLPLPYEGFSLSALILAEREEDYR